MKLVLNKWSSYTDQVEEGAGGQHVQHVGEVASHLLVHRPHQRDLVQRPAAERARRVRLLDLRATNRIQ